MSSHFRCSFRCRSFSIILVFTWILYHSDNTSKTLQKSDISASEGQDVAKMTLQTLSSLRSDENFKLFWELVIQAAKELDISDALLPWQRKMSIRYEIGNDLLIIQIILLNASILKQLTSLPLVS